MVVLKSQVLVWVAVGLFSAWGTADAQVAATAASTATAAPVAAPQLPPGNYLQGPGSSDYYQVPTLTPPSANQGTPAAATPMNVQPQAPYGGGTTGGLGFPSQGGGTALPTGPTPAAGTISGPQGLQVRRFGISGGGAGVGGAPPPRSVMAGPEGSRKLQSLSGDHLYLDGGLRVKLAGVIVPPGAEGNPVRSAVRDLVRTNYFFVEREQGSPPFGDTDSRAWVNLPDGRNLSLELIARGLVRVSRQSSFRTTEERDALFNAEDEARRHATGVWSK